MKNKMNMKEAIEKISNNVIISNYDAIQIIDLLTHLSAAQVEGEKYKKYWEEFKNKHGDYPMDEYIDIATQMNNLEQKYFPNPIKKIITIEVEAKDKDHLNWFIQHFIMGMEIKINDLHEKDNIKINIKEG